jgi:hypothetical protein
VRRATLVALVCAGGLSCGGDGAKQLPRPIIDCSGDDTICDDVPDTGCSVVLMLVDATGQVVGNCGDDPATEQRICTKHCEGLADCPDGWACQLPASCPGENLVQYCVPSTTELEAQDLSSCRGDASPRVCGFF